MNQATANKIINFCANHGIVSQLKKDGFVGIHLPDNKKGHKDFKVKTLMECLEVLGY